MRWDARIDLVEDPTRLHEKGIDFRRAAIARDTFRMI
jgi:hypothetical protein